MLTVAVIGSGFSGALTAVHLLRSTTCAVTLIDRSGRFGPGLAYSTPSPVHYLNVPAGNMSAFDDDPGHFLRWAQERDAAVVTGSFLPRAVYGAYLEHLLNAAGSDAKDRLRRVPHAALAIEHDRHSPSGGRLRVLTAEAGGLRGAAVAADRVVLALGNALPPHPPVPDDGAFEHPAYVRNPWDASVLDRIRPDEPILIVGTGLTMMDVVMSLQARDHTGRILAISRHGLLPRPHRSPSRPPAHRPPPAALKSWDGSARLLLHILRADIRENAFRGTDWRDVVTSIRPITPDLWRRMNARERDRFLARLRSFWEIVRHRAAPETAAAVADLIASRRLAVRAGRLVSLRPLKGRASLVEAAFRPRGSQNVQIAQVARVINCLGPDTDVRRIDDPLLKQLIATGQVTPDVHGLGLEVSDTGAAVGKDRRPNQAIYVIGPLRKAQAWENTAVPELRKQAAAVAAAAAK